MRRRAVLLSALVVACVGVGATPAFAAGPTAIGIDNAGVVYVGFANGGQIKRYAGTDGAPLAPWGTPGSGAGQIGGVVAIDVAPGGTGNVWVLDSNRRVQEFTRAGQFVRGLQLNACEGAITPDPLQRGGLDVSSDSVYVAHPCANSLLRLRLSDLQTQATASPAAPKGISAQLYSSAPPNTVALYAAQPSLNQVSIFQPQFFSQHGHEGHARADRRLRRRVRRPVRDRHDATTSSISTAPTATSSARSAAPARTSVTSTTRWRSTSSSSSPSSRATCSSPTTATAASSAGARAASRTGGLPRTSSAPPGCTSPHAGCPANTAAPQIQGTPTQGSSVNCTQGTWTNSPTGYAYGWLRDGAPIGGATAASYTISAADVGRNLTCMVTATNAAGSGQATSAAVVPVAARAGAGNQARPVISGTPAPGNVLSCSTGTWTSSPTSYVRSWRRDGTPFASGTTYTVQAADVGHVLTCAVTATNAAGSTEAVSDPVTVTNGSCANGRTGVSINAGATFTNSPGVVLTIHEPPGATGVLISNDGGFAAPTGVAVACTDQYSRTLTSSGAERLPKTIYVRFTGPGIDVDKTFTDDIVLDQRAPVMTRASLRSAQVAPAAKSSARTRYVLALGARDSGSGVAKIQTASSRTARRQTTYRYRSTLRLRYATSARYVRAVDRAGNVGAWKKVALSKALRS